LKPLIKREKIQQGILYTFTLLGIISPIAMFSIIPIVRADNINPGVYSPDAKPYGFTFPDWSEKWWRWLVSSPESVNPTKDDTGKNCGMNQNDPNVWYLTGAGSGTITRTCPIPAGKAILFQPAGNECSYAENPSLKTEPELRACAIAGDQVSSIHVSVDGRTIQDLQHYIVQTPLFNMTFPQNNLFGAPAGNTQGVSHAYLTFLQPLPLGDHEIHFDQVTLGNPETGTGNYAYDVTYHLKVK